MSSPPPSPPSRAARLAPAVLLWLFAATFVVLTYRLPPNARTMPVLVGWTTLALTSLDIVTRLASPLGTALMRALNPSGLVPHHDETQTIRGLVTGVGLVVMLIGAFILAGVLPAAALVIFGAIMLAYPRQWLSNILIASGATLGIWLLFAVLLRLTLYRGILFGDVL